jgi:hypothetical protein
MPTLKVFAGGNLPEDLAAFLNADIGKGTKIEICALPPGSGRESMEWRQKLWQILKKYYLLPELEEMATCDIEIELRHDRIATIRSTFFLEKKSN